MTVIQKNIERLTRFADRPWFPFAMGFLALLDFFVMVIPADGVLISSVMLTPKRWIGLAITMAVGSTIGALILAGLINWHGMDVVLYLFPTITELSIWKWLESIFAHHGLLVVFGVSATPLMIQPAIVMACLAEVPLKYLMSVVLLGRLIKSLILAYLASHAPRYLSIVSRWLN